MLISHQSYPTVGGGLWPDRSSDERRRRVLRHPRVMDLVVAATQSAPAARRLAAQSAVAVRQLAPPSAVSAHRSCRGPPSDDSPGPSRGNLQMLLSHLVCWAVAELEN